MKQTLIINLSPREKGSSCMLASMCKEYLLSQGKQVKLFHLYKILPSIDLLLKDVKESDTIILSGPSYINHFPADTIYLLEKLKENKHIFHNQNMYGIIQGGMPYVHTHESGVKTLALFCKDISISYKGSFIIGFGAMLNGQTLDKLINGKKVKKNFNLFLQNILEENRSPDTLFLECQIKAPGFLYQLLSGYMNKKIDKDLKEKGIDYQEESPYWQR